MDSVPYGELKYYFLEKTRYFFSKSGIVPKNILIIEYGFIILNISDINGFLDVFDQEFDPHILVSGINIYTEHAHMQSDGPRTFEKVIRT